MSDPNRKRKIQQLVEKQQQQQQHQQLERERKRAKTKQQTQKQTQKQKQMQIQKQKQMQMQIQKQKQMQIQKQKQKQKQTQKQKQKQKQIQIQKQKQKQKQIQIQKQKQMQIQKQTQIQKQMQIQKQIQIQKQNKEEKDHPRTVKWFEPIFEIQELINKVITPSGRKKRTYQINAFGSELIDQKWINKQYKYWQSLRTIDKLYLQTYTYYGDFLINLFLSEGEKQLNINKIIHKSYSDNINPFFPLFLDYYGFVFEPDKKGKMYNFLNEKMNWKDRYENFCLFFKTINEHVFKKNLLFLMKKYNENLNRIIDSSPKLNKELLVARGSTKTLSYDDMWTNRFTSTSISFRSAMRFATDLDLTMNGYIDIFMLQPGTPCIPIFNSKYKQELEILLGSGCCRYNIIENKKLMKSIKKKAIDQLKHINKKLIYSDYQQNISEADLVRKAKKDVTIRYYEVKPKREYLKYDEPQENELITIDDLFAEEEKKLKNTRKQAQENELITIDDLFEEEQKKLKRL